MISRRPTARAGGIAGAIIRPIRQSPIQNQRLRPIHIPNPIQRAVLIVRPIRHHRIPKRTIARVVAPTRAVLVAQTRHGQAFVLVGGAVVVVVGVVVVITVGAVEPEAGEEAQGGAAEGEGDDAGGGAAAGLVGACGAAAVVSSAAVGGSRY